ncbi:MAG: response regulator [Natronospirillum sp.]|uniref:ATP-binding protein n=1 Tax=Natronospirillum sp. TaxID=2812955 RepID=UPI0025F7BC10|nr:ATP-binding protein [Natronospirillum sp.]MCH8551943.1 response regulator [Natronospirillum sp.]
MRRLTHLWLVLLVMASGAHAESRLQAERQDLLLHARVLVDSQAEISHPEQLLEAEWQQRMVPMHRSPWRQSDVDGPVWVQIDIAAPASRSVSRMLLTLSSPALIGQVRIWDADLEEQTLELFPHLYGQSLPVQLDSRQNQRWFLRLDDPSPPLLLAHLEPANDVVRRSLIVGAWLFGLSGSGLLAAGSLATLQYRRHRRSERAGTDIRWLLWPAYLVLIVVFGLSYYLGLPVLLSQAGVPLPSWALQWNSSLSGMSIGMATVLLALIWWKRGLDHPARRHLAWLMLPAALAVGHTLGAWPFLLILFGLCLCRLSGLGVRRNDVHSLPTVGAILSLLFWLAVEALQASSLALTGLIELIIPPALLALHALFVYQSYFARYRARPILTARSNPVQAMGNQYTEVLLRKLNHDLRSPIHGVLGMTNLLSETPLNRDQQEYVTTTHNAGIQMLNLADEMRALTRISQDNIQVRPGEVELNSFLHEVVNPFARLASQKSVEVVTEVLSNVPSEVRIDGELVSQVLRIVLDNSVKFTEEGVIEVAIRREGQRRLRLRVDDTGRGIPEQDVRRLFEFQAVSPEDGNQQEVRLGLPVANALVRALGGQIGISRTAGRGTSVWISLPFEPVTKVESEDRKDELQPLHQHLTQQKVLVVDDHLASRKVLEDQTRNWGMLPELASSGKEALAILQSHMYFHQPFDWVIIDYRMPEMNGLELLEKIRATDGLKNLRVIVMTGIDLHYVEQAAQDLGAIAVLAKPVNPRKLMRLLQEEDR